MKTATIMLAVTLLLSIRTLAQEPPVARPGTADVNAPLPSSMSPQDERKAVAAEQAKVPIGGILGMASDRDAEGNAVRITSASVHIGIGQLVWFIEACGGTVLPTPKQQAAIRAYFAKYTTAEVIFLRTSGFARPGAFSSTTPVHIEGCK